MLWRFSFMGTPAVAGTQEDREPKFLPTQHARKPDSEAQIRCHAAREARTPLRRKPNMDASVHQRLR